MSETRALLDALAQRRPLVPPAGLALLQRGPAPAAPDPVLIEDAFARGLAAGRAEGEAAALAALAPDRARLAEAAAALEAACRIDAEALAPLLADLVRALCETVLAAELRAGAAVLMPLVEAALALVQPDEAPCLAAHPDVLAALAPHLPAGLVTQADAALPLDAFAVRGAEFVIAEGLAARLDAVLAG
jgi:flagellar assembly protein FliH